MNSSKPIANGASASPAEGARPRSAWKHSIRSLPLGRIATALGALYRRALSILRLPAPDNSQLLQRVQLMERDIILPLKAAGIAMLLYSFYFKPWMGRVLSALDIAVESTQYLFWVYVVLNLVAAALLFQMRRIPISMLEWMVFVMCLVDGIFLSALTLVTGGYDSILYWLFLGLIVRGAVSVPRATSQIMLNLTISSCYVFSGLVALAVWYHLPEFSRQESGLSGAQDDYAEPLVLRIVLLLLVTVCAYGVHILFERQRIAEEEAREFAVREGQLRSAGRLAAEIAHQIKNPLAIITNAAYSLQRSLKQGKTNVGEHIQIIQEEVERSDRIITQIMGYAQLAEGRVEKVEVTEELENAIRRVFPEAAEYPVGLHRNFAASAPALLMQRRHVEEIFMNVLQNAREALASQAGNVWITMVCGPDSSVEVSIRDDGPGIPRHKQESVFEAYYTTKEKGTGLGLATVKHNIELYGGSVRLESELGKGACFRLFFPARTLMRSEQTS